jgi:hypothetical protein
LAIGLCVVTSEDKPKMWGAAAPFNPRIGAVERGAANFSRGGNGSSIMGGHRRRDTSD